MPYGVSRSKITVPDLPPGFVHRPELLDALERRATSALTLVSAPAGSGKTLLLAEWVRSRSASSAWVALDEDDDQPGWLWTAVLAALVGCPAVPPDNRLHRLAGPPTVVGPDFLTEVLDALAALPERIVLVLDDAHHLRSPAVLHGLRSLLRGRRTPVRLVLAGRTDPALPIARLRLEGRLCELRAAALNLSVEETAALLDGCGVRLTPQQTRLLHARTDGWAAGVRLAAQRLQGHPHPDRVLAEFSGDERPVAEYLLGEVIAPLSEDEVTVLRRTSISDTLPAGLAVALSGDARAAQVLASLERNTGLVVRSGPQRMEYRIQELLRSYLVADLRRHGPALAEQLHRQAAEWWDTHGRPADALSHAAEAGDPILLAGLLRRWAADLVGRGDHVDLHDVRPATEAATGAETWFSLVAAQEALARGDRAAARAELLRDRPPAMTTDPDAACFRLATERLAGIGRPVAPDEALPDGPALTALVLAGRGAARVFACGDAQSAAEVQADLTAALDLARGRGLGHLELQCLCLIGVAALTAGDHRRACSAAVAATSSATAHGWVHSPWTAGAYAVLAHAELVRARPSASLSAATAGLRDAPREQDPVVRFTLRTARGGARADTGNRPAALLELQNAFAELASTPVPVPVIAAAALLEHRVALLLGSPAAAATSTSRLATRGVAAPELCLMRARSQAAAGSVAAARAAVAPLVAGTHGAGLPCTLVEAWLLEAWAALREGDRPAARTAVQTALGVAEPLDALRPFALTGQGVRTLIAHQLGGGRDPTAFGTRALAARLRDRLPSDAPLSVRELDVMSRLNSLSNLGEIAEDLQVSVNTVKTHVRAIYCKLNVTTRRTAVLIAQEQGLLS